MEERNTEDITLSKCRFVSDINSITIKSRDGFKATLTKEEFLQRLVETLECTIKDLWIEKMILKGLHVEPRR